MNHWENEEDHYFKSLQTGIPAKSGVLSAMLATRGYLSAPNVLDDNYNIFDAFSGVYEFDKLTDTLGECWEIMCPQVPVGKHIDWNGNHEAEQIEEENQTNSRQYK